MQELYYELPYKNSARILHFPIHATCPPITYSMMCPHQYTAKSGYHDGSLHYATVSHPSATACTFGRKAFPHHSILKHPQSYVLQQNCVFYTYLLLAVFEESQKLSVLNGYNTWKQICGCE
jgi:hypothetical protein